MADLPELWEFQRVRVHQHIYWSAPAPGFLVRGVEFTSPQTIVVIRLDGVRVATSARTVANTYPHLEYTPGPLRLWTLQKSAGFEFSPGSSLHIELREPLGAGFAELWLEPLEAAHARLERAYKQNRKRREKVESVKSMLGSPVPPRHQESKRAR